MNIAQASEPAPRKPLRLWPGVVAVVLLSLGRFVVPIVLPEAVLFGVLGGVLGALVVIVWWAFFSRAPRLERWGAIVLMIVALIATSRIIDKSIATGMMGFMFAIYSIPILSLAFVVWAVFSQRLSDGPRRASMVATILLACGVWTLLRTNGMTGEGSSDFAWRWSKTREERLVAQAGGKLSAFPPAPVPVRIPAAPLVAHKAKDQPVAPPPTPVAAETEADWPGFRGPGRDSIIPGIRIKTDWSTSPPVELWRRQIGPGWSSFAVRGDLIYTQEQRGDDELVTCYNATTGNPVWAHRDAARFWESNAGAGPRATPTLHDGHVYTFGATGILDALDAGDGAVLWSRNAASDTGKKVPGWGFASSPLVVGDSVIVAAAGQLVAYDVATGTPRWFGPAGGASYSSPHLVTLDGVAQILLMSALGATSVAPADGRLLWKHSWPSDTRIMQPAVTADGDLLISAGDAMGGIGMRRIAVAHGPAGWTTEERWTSAGLKPNFNDFVLHDGHVFGFDGAILACIDAKDGKRKWKGGRYGHGQLVLLRDQGLLLVLSEEGELALVRAASDQFTELARVPAMEGKTWNHPVLAGDRLLVRNGNEMVAFRLPLAGGVLLVIERNQGLLRRLASSPMSRSSVVLGKWGARMSLGVIQIAFAMLTGTLLFHIHWGPHLPALLVVLFCYGALGATLGILLGNFARTEGQAISFGVIAANLLAALGGCWWPIEVTPPWAQKLAVFLPTGWAMDAIHKLVSFGYGPAAVAPHILVMVVTASLAGLVVARTFRFQ